jgi:hypothetical protein
MVGVMIYLWRFRHIEQPGLFTVTVTGTVGQYLSCFTAHLPSTLSYLSI